MITRQENSDEFLAQEWLKSQGHRDIQRPCSDPPDFVVGGIVAVEVTRLDQRILVGTNEQSIGVEEARQPLRGQIENTIKKLGPPGNDGKSWVIDCEYDFSVPLPKRGTVSAQLSGALAPLLRPYDDKAVADMHARHFDFDRHAGESSCMGFPHLCLKCGICLELEEFSNDPPKFFLQNVSDGMGIAVAEELGKAVQNRIRIKSDNIRNRNRTEQYGSWRLVLIDRVCLLPMPMLSEHELAVVQDQDYDFWERVIIVNSMNPGCYYDLRGE